MRGKETVIIIRSGELDWRGDPGAELPPRVVTGCIVWPRTSTEDATRGEVIIDGLNVLMPAGTDILATDDVVAREKRYSVEGVPGDYQRKGILVSLRRVGS